MPGVCVCVCVCVCARLRVSLYLSLYFCMLMGSDFALFGVSQYDFAPIAWCGFCPGGCSGGGSDSFDS